MIQALTYVYLVFVLIFKTVFPFGLPPKAVPAADTGSLAAVDALGRKAVSAGETFEPNVLCCAESSDGISWKRSPPGPVLVKNPQKEYERDRIGGCQVIPHGELGYLVFYIGYRDINTACICAARSDDGVTDFRRCKLNPLVAPTEGEWDRDSCYKPSALYDREKDLWRIWYNGRRAGAEYVGLAEKLGDFTAGDFE
ncbi:MAG: hypothetical protein K6G71_00585 [Clostridiales bacterium]|nr:hypothetical protein [Clostridiales bacterium]